ncbi:MAG: hypothetical protein ACKPHU_32740 [Planctomycetaceae bacterium]
MRRSAVAGRCPRVIEYEYEYRPPGRTEYEYELVARAGGHSLQAGGAFLPVVYDKISRVTVP